MPDTALVRTRKHQDEASHVLPAGAGTEARA
jgi:hypothetical protein